MEEWERGLEGDAVADRARGNGPVALGIPNCLHTHHWSLPQQEEDDESQGQIKQPTYKLQNHKFASVSDFYYNVYTFSPYIFS